MAGFVGIERTGLVDTFAHEQHVIERLAAGDPAALGDVYDRHGAVAFAVIVRIVGERPVAEELLQETFLRVWQHAGTYNGALGGVRPWLLGIAHNLALNELRRRRRRPAEAEPTHPDAPSPLETMAAHGPNPEAEAWTRARHERLHHALDQLAAPQRAVIALYADGYSQSEIAIHLAEPLGTVKSRMRRGLQELRGILREEGYDVGAG